MADVLTVDDLPNSIVASVREDELAIMVAGANAKALRVAPCLADAPAAARAEALLVLFGAVKRWAEAGSGAVQTEQAGPFSQTIDTRRRSGYNLWPSEIENLQSLCADGSTGKAFAVDTAPSGASAHMPWCALAFGAIYCSCGADLTADTYPLYEGGILSGDAWP